MTTPETELPVSNIPRKAVTSSQLAEVGHDPATNTLAVKFKHGSGGIYHYANVTAEDHEKLMKAPSVGSHFIQNIKKNPAKHPFVKHAEQKAAK